MIGLEHYLTLAAMLFVGGFGFGSKIAGSTLLSEIVQENFEVWNSY